MVPLTANAFEIRYYSGAIMTADMFAVCKTYVSAKGLIRTTFIRDIKYSDDFFFGEDLHLPVSMTYKYKLKDNAAAALFEEFDLLKLEPSELDMMFPDGGSWQMTIFTNGINKTIKGYMPPEPFGEKLAERVRGLIKYEKSPMLF